MIRSFLVGLIVGILAVFAGAYWYIASGHAPVATSAPPLPFERFLANKALDARLAREPLRKSPLEPAATNLLAGAIVYQQHCAMCHGLPEQAKSALAAGMFPPPPQLFHGQGVTDDPPGETYWKAANGIRLTGMPGFRQALTEDQLWQVSLLLANANDLPATVKTALAPKDQPASPARQ